MIAGKIFKFQIGNLANYVTPLGYNEYMKPTQKTSCKWKNLRTDSNTYFRMNKKGQFEILGHLSSQKDISQTCKALYDILNYEWQVIEEKQRQNNQENLYQHKDLFSKIKPFSQKNSTISHKNSLKQIKELYPFTITDESA